MAFDGRPVGIPVYEFSPLHGGFVPIDSRDADIKYIMLQSLDAVSPTEARPAVDEKYKRSKLIEKIMEAEGGCVELTDDEIKLIKGRIEICDTWSPYTMDKACKILDKALEG